VKRSLLEGAAAFVRGLLARLTSSVWLAPGAKAAAALAGVLVLAAIGGSARAVPVTPPPASAAAAVPSSPPSPSAAASSSSSTTPSPTSSSPPTSAPAPPPRATPEAPVILNLATTDDLRRLPGIGPKRAEAILTLRTKIGRFHSVEELLRVKGIGRATLRRLRPLVRVD
jgi:competence protein ComEA